MVRCAVHSYTALLRPATDTPTPRSRRPGHAESSLLHRRAPSACTVPWYALIYARGRESIIVRLGSAMGALRILGISWACRMDWKREAEGET